MLNEILASMGSDVTQVVSKTNPLGRGRIFHGGQIIKCAGLMGPNPRLVEDAAFSPPAEVLIQHVIGTFVGDENTSHAIGNKECDDSVFVIDPTQSAIDPSNPVCQICGQPPVI